MTDITIPPEALEAAARVIYNILEGSVADQDYRRQMRQWEQAQALASAACLAMLKNWPKMHIGAPWVIGVPNAPSIILPLTETPNDK